MLLPVPRRKAQVRSRPVWRMSSPSNGAARPAWGVIAGTIGSLSAGISKPMRRKLHEMPRLVTDPQSHRR
ncbi:hypothetical protein [Streptomyces sp. NPDC013187]|uniref:hypothetical protein n=1 Tax=Streptomyces sp. NPDC013187 TaxID=3364865 RepID=UPI0036B34269